MEFDRVEENEKNEKKEAEISLYAIGLVTEGSMEVKPKNLITSLMLVPYSRIIVNPRLSSYRFLTGSKPSLGAFGSESR